MKFRRFNINSWAKSVAFAMIGVFAYSFSKKYIEKPWYRYALYAALLGFGIPVPAALEIVNQLFNQEN